MKIGRLAATVLCAALLVSVFPAGPVRADDGDWEFGAVAYLVFGTIVVDTGVTIANLIMIGSDTVDPRVGWIGVGAGVVSYTLIAAATVEGDYEGPGFPMVMGTLGTMALGTGILVLRSGEDGAQTPETGSRLSVAPCLVRGEDGRPAPGLAMRLDF